ncbi:MAG: EamA family transporter [Clostridia bacterium]|nr:EamA family transporter [Clostridia bacterium]
MQKHVISVLAAGALWGLMGFFTRNLAEYGISSTGAILLRCGVAAICFGLTILITGPGQFRVKPQHFWCFFGSGICSLLFFTYCYFEAITLMSLSTAAILLYTAPTIVMLLSAVFFKEKITPVKLAALVLAFAGCCLVSGMGMGDSALSLTGLLYGLGAGVGYALYSIFARCALNRGYSSSTVNFYSCLLAALGAALIWGVEEPVAALTGAPACIVLSLAMGAVSCYLPYLLYTYGLTGLETGRASVLSSFEPVMATLVGIIVFHEPMTIMSACGVLCVLAAIVLLNVRFKRRTAKKA